MEKSACCNALVTTTGGRSYRTRGSWIKVCSKCGDLLSEKAKKRKVLYPERIREEVTKFCDKNDMKEEDVSPFVEWIIWYTGQRIKKELKQIMESALK